MPDPALARRGRRSGLIGAAIAAITCATAFTGAAPVSAATDEVCTVSELLVPSCGAWLGASTPSNDGSYDYVQGLDEYEAVAKNVPDILHFYKTDGVSFPTDAEVAMTQRSGHQESLLYYNWKPSTSLDWRQVANGAADDNIRLAASGLQRYPGRLFLSIFHEPENNQGGPGSGDTPADYVAMYRHVVTMLRAEGVTNVVYVMNFMGFEAWSAVADAFYPGDDVVDWIAYDPYGFADQPTFASLLNRPSQQWPGFYDWATAKAPGKPIMLGEWGFDLVSQPTAPSVLDGAVSALRTQFPMLKALVYWNDRTDTLNTRLDQPTELGAVYGDAYERMANNAYFNSTSVTAASEPVADDPAVPSDALPSVGGNGAVPSAALDAAHQFDGAVPASSLLAILSIGLIGLVLVRRQRDLESSSSPARQIDVPLVQRSSVDETGALRRRNPGPDPARRQVVRPDVLQRRRSQGSVALAAHEEPDNDASEDEALDESRTSELAE